MVGCLGARLGNFQTGHLRSRSRCCHGYGLGLSLGNDEPIAAHLWGLPSLTFVGVLAAPFVVIVWCIVRTFHGSRRSKVLHVLGLGLTALCLAMLVGNVLSDSPLVVSYCRFSRR
jgi:hypothetical protein